MTGCVEKRKKYTTVDHNETRGGQLSEQKYAFFGHFLSYFVLFDQNDFCFFASQICQQNCLFFVHLKWLTLGVITMSVQARWYG